MRKEVVDAVLAALPKEEKAGYEHLSKRDQQKIQKNLLKAFAGNPEAVRYSNHCNALLCLCPFTLTVDNKKVKFTDC